MPIEIRVAKEERAADISQFLSRFAVRTSRQPNGVGLLQSKLTTEEVLWFIKSFAVIIALDR